MTPLILQRMQHVRFSTWSRRRHCFCSNGGEPSPSEQKTKSLLYLHVGPSGDVWTGDSIFAAKQNTPGYVRSVPLFRKDSNVDRKKTNDETKTDILLAAMHRQPERLVEILEENLEWSLEIYETENFSDRLLQQLSQQISLMAQDDDDDENNDTKG